MVTSYDEFLQEGDQVEAGSADSPPPEGYVPAHEPEGASPAHRIMDAGKQYEERSQTFKILSVLIQRVQEGSRSALNEIVEKFATPPDQVQVVITKPLRNRAGKEPSEFGMRVIENDEELQRLMDDYALVAEFFPNLELQVVPTTTKGKRLAVVMGVTAVQFNAMLAAIRHKARLEVELAHLEQQMHKERQEMNVANTPLQAAQQEISHADRLVKQNAAAAEIDPSKGPGVG